MPGSSGAQTLSLEETEDLVRQTYFEGLPEDEATRIGPEGALRLLEMLADPAERDNHARILIALGFSAPPGACEAIEAWQATALPAEGELDRSAFRAWQALPFALGHLADRDPEAIASLEAFMNAGAPGWTFRHHRGARLTRLSRRSAASALAETGLPAARAALDRAGRNLSDSSDVTDADFEAHLQQMRALHAERARARSRQAGEPVR